MWFDAAASGSEEQLERLLELGQDVNDDSSNTCSSMLDGTALHHATLKVNNRRSQALHRTGLRLRLSLRTRSRTASYRCYFAVQGRAGAVRVLLQAGADPNLADWEHQLTPLHLAAVGKQSHMRGEVVELLLAGRARLWAEDAHGLTPLHYARQHEASDVLKQMGNAAACRLQARGRGMWVGGQLSLMREALRLAHDAERRLLGPDDRGAIPTLGRKLDRDATGRYGSNAAKKTPAAPVATRAQLAGGATDADKLLHAACQYMAAQGFEAGHLADAGLEAWLRSKQGAAVLDAAAEEIEQLDAAASAEVLALRFRAVQLEVTAAALCATQQEAVAKLHAQLVQWMPRLDSTLSELRGGAPSPFEEAGGTTSGACPVGGPAAGTAALSDAGPELTVQAAHVFHATERALRGKVRDVTCACIVRTYDSRAPVVAGVICVHGVRLAGAGRRPAVAAA